MPPIDSGDPAPWIHPYLRSSAGWEQDVSKDPTPDIGSYDPLHPITPPELDSEAIARIQRIEDEIDKQARIYHPNVPIDPFRLPLQSLPPDLRKEYTARLDVAYGYDTLLAGGPKPAWVRPFGIPGNPYGRIPVEGVPGNIRLSSVGLRLQNFQYEAGREGAETVNVLHGSGRRYRMAQQLNVARIMNVQVPLVDPGKTITVLDIESAGLGEHAGISSIAARKFYRRDDGIVELQGEVVKHFVNPMMRRGIMGGMTTEEYFAQQHGIQFSEFKSGMTEMLDFLNSSDVIAGHNVTFDIQKIMESVNQARPEDRDELLSNAYREFEDIYKTKSVVDTHQWAQLLLPNLEVHPALAEMDRHQPYSVTNLLLQTNLLGRLQEDQGWSREDIIDILGRQHGAAPDVALESPLLQYFNEMITGTGPGLAPVSVIDPDIISAAVGPRPITPYLPLSHPDQVAPELIEPLINMGVLERDGADNLSFRQTLTPVEQEILLQRRMDDRVVAHTIGSGYQEHLASALHSFYTISGREEAGRLNLRKTLSSPSRSDWAMQQARLRRGGVPYSGLSFYERMLTSAFGRAAPRGTDAEVANFRKAWGPELGISHFVNSTRIYRSEGGKIIMPAQILEAAQQAGALTGFRAQGAITGLELDPFRFFPTNAAGERIVRGERAIQRKEIGLVYHFQDGEAEALAGFLKSHPELVTQMGIAQEDFESVIKELLRPGGAERYGVSIGTLGGLGGGQDINAVWNALVDQMGGEEVGRDQRVPYSTPYHGINERGEIVTGPVIHSRIDEAFGAQLYSDRLASEAHAEALANLDAKQTATAARFAHGIRTQSENAGDVADATKDLETASRWSRGTKGFYDVFRVAAPVGAAIGATAAATGYYIRKRHEKSVYNQTIALQPRESREEARKLAEQARQQSAYMRSQDVNQNDPLQTAGLPFQLNNNRINHTKYGPEKYKFLFGQGYS